jgi:hypothetical protein
MLANLQDALPARTAVSKSSRSWSRCSWLSDPMSILCALSTSSGLTFSTAVFELHRIVVPSGSGMATVPQSDPHHLRVARLDAGHGKDTLLPPKLGPLPTLLNGLQKLRMLLMPVKQRSSRNTDPGRHRLSGKAIGHGFDEPFAHLATIECGPSSSMFGLFHRCASLRTRRAF